MLNEENNPYNPPPKFSVSINVTKAINWWRNRKSKKPITEAELYDMPPCGRREGCASCPDRDRCALIS